MTPPERLQDVTLAERLQQEIAAWEDWSTDHDDTPLTTVALLKEAAAALSVRGDVSVEWIVNCSMGHGPNPHFDDEAKAVARWQEESAIPSYVRPGQLRKASITKVTTITQDCTPATPQAPQPVVDGYRHSTHHVHRGPDSLPCYCTATVDHAIGQEQNAEAEALAHRFHEAYERLAPSFGYETRTETRQFDPATPNGRLMIAVCASLTQPQQGAVEAFDAGWRMAAAWAYRDDLLADMDSSAYKTERGAALAAHGKGG